MYVQLMRYNKSQFVLEMSTNSFDTSMKTSMPLSDCGIDDALIKKMTSLNVNVTK